jgi:hypothetical protein
MRLYFNGDSFVAGVELGDDILPEYPGLATSWWSNTFWGIPHPTALENKKWLAKTYDNNHPFAKLRQQHTEYMQSLEFDRAFPNKVAQITDLPVINHALGGSSMDRIARVSLLDLYKLKQEYPKEKIVAIIGTTHPSRSEIINDKLGVTDYHKTYQDWICISATYKVEGQGEYVDTLCRYKILYEKHFHSLVNFYKNIILVKDFCKINEIDLYWIATHDTVNRNYNVEPYLSERPILSMMKEYAKLEYYLDMKDYLNKDSATMCPGWHFGENVHQLVANDIAALINKI